MKWSEGDTVKFVELYREHECLWNMTKPSYRSNTMRTAALQKLVEEMGMDGFTVADARQKVKSLRNTYIQELQKIEKSIKSETGREVYLPRLKWFQIMDTFMRQTRENRPSRNNLESSFTEQDEEGYTPDTADEEHGTFTETPPRVPATRTVNSGKAAQPRSLDGSSSGKKRRCQDLPAAVSELRRINQPLRQQIIEEDEFDAFGRYIALGLKKLPIHLALECQSELHSILARHRLLSITPSSRCSSSSSV